MSSSSSARSSFPAAKRRSTPALSLRRRGHFAYIYALADTRHVALAAPMISAYYVASVLWGRIFLKEKLSWKHYLMIAFVVAGIVMLGMYDE